MIEDPHDVVLNSTSESTDSYLQATESELKKFKKKNDFQGYMEATYEARKLYWSLARPYHNWLGEILIRQRDES